MVKCNKVDFYTFTWRLKSVEKKVVEVKKVEEAKGALKAELSTVKSVVTVKVR